jgi:hypothetical protein
MSVMKEAVIYWLATSESEIHYIDAIISAYDGMAAVRRDFEIRDGRAMYKVFVSPGMEEEFQEVMARLRATAEISDLIREDGLASV